MTFSARVDARWAQDSREVMTVFHEERTRVPSTLLMAVTNGLLEMVPLYYIDVCTRCVHTNYRFVNDAQHVHKN